MVRYLLKSGMQLRLDFSSRIASSRCAFAFLDGIDFLERSDMPGGAKAKRAGRNRNGRRADADVDVGW